MSQPAPVSGSVISRQPEPDSGGGVSVANIPVHQIQAQQAPVQPQVVYIRQQPFRENDDTLCMDYACTSLQSRYFVIMYLVAHSVCTV